MNLLLVQLRRSQVDDPLDDVGLLQVIPFLIVASDVKLCVLPPSSEDLVVDELDVAFLAEPLRDLLPSLLDLHALGHVLKASLLDHFGQPLQVDERRHDEMSKRTRADETEIMKKID